MTQTQAAHQTIQITQTALIKKRCKLIIEKFPTVSFPLIVWSSVSIDFSINSVKYTSWSFEDSPSRRSVCAKEIDMSDMSDEEIIEYVRGQNNPDISQEVHDWILNNILPK